MLLDIFHSPDTLAGDKIWVFYVCSFYISKYLSFRASQHQASMLALSVCVFSVSCRENPREQVTELQCLMYLCDTNTSERWGEKGMGQEHGQRLVCSTMWPSHLVPS